LEGRSNAVAQTSTIKGSTRLGTLLIPKNRRFYDFVLKVDVMTRARGPFGVIFRMVDPFNFLGLEININEGYKRVIKMQHGNIRQLKRVNDGGMSQNNWFKIQVKGRKNKFLIRMGDSKTYSNYQAAPIVFEFDDISNTGLDRGHQHDYRKLYLEQ